MLNRNSDENADFCEFETQMLDGDFGGQFGSQEVFFNFEEIYMA